MRLLKFTCYQVCVPKNMGGVKMLGYYKVTVNGLLSFEKHDLAVQTQQSSESLGGSSGNCFHNHCFKLWNLNL